MLLLGVGSFIVTNMMILFPKRNVIKHGNMLTIYAPEEAIFTNVISIHFIVGLIHNINFDRNLCPHSHISTLKTNKSRSEAKREEQRETHISDTS